MAGRGSSQDTLVSDRGLPLATTPDADGIHDILKASAAPGPGSSQPNWRARRTVVTAANTPTLGPNVAAPDGFAILCTADPDNDARLFVARAGESGAAGTRYPLDPGDSITLSLANMAGVEFRSTSATAALYQAVEQSS